MPESFSIYMSLSDGVSLEELEPDQLIVDVPANSHLPRLALNQLTPGLRRAMRKLSEGDVSRASLAGLVALADGMQGIGKLDFILGKLDQSALLTHRLHFAGEAQVSIHPYSKLFNNNPKIIDAKQTYVVSRFACFRSELGKQILESPRGHAEVRLPGRTAQICFLELSAAKTASELADAVDGLDTECAHELMTILANAAIIVEADGDRSSEEWENPTLAAWSFHDMFFHTRSRLGRHAEPYGGTYPFKDQFELLPAIKPPMSKERVALFIPDFDAIIQADRSFTQVMEERASLREKGSSALTFEQLGEFLYRSARVKKHLVDDGVSFRPSPSGGAIHSLEIYPLIDNCEGVDPGLYHYNPFEHALYKVTKPIDSTNALADLAGVTGVINGRPQVLLIFASRFQRVQLKYQSVTYGVILKDVGALYQTMYLVATAMGLAPSALGGGHADLFTQATGLDYFAESSVGEFILNTRSNKDKPVQGLMPTKR